MIEKKRRPLKDKELCLLKTSISSLKRKGNKLWKQSLISSLIVCGLLWIPTMLVAKASWVIIAIFWLCIGVGISLWNIIAERWKTRKRIAGYESAINRNEAEKNDCEKHYEQSARNPCFPPIYFLRREIGKTVPYPVFLHLISLFLRDL